ncbi:amino acid permease, partial [Erysiphe pulchra]
TKQVFWRISLFYIVSLFVLGLIVPSDNPSLSKASDGATRYSPFVLSIKLAGIKVLPSIFNAVITLSVISVANTCTFGSTRTIQALCASGMGPAIGAKVDKKGRPHVVLIIVLLFGCLAFVNEAKNGSVAFTWLLSLSGLSNFFSWGSICYAHIRFRKVWAMNGRTVDDLPFATQFGVIGSWIGLGLNILCLIAQFYLAISPISREPGVGVFFEHYLAFPVVIIFFIGYKIYFREWSIGIDLKSINVDEGRRDINLEELKRELEEERVQKAILPWWRRVILDSIW